MSKKGLIARTSALLLLPAAFAATAFTVGCGDDKGAPDAAIDAPPPPPAALSINPQSSDFASVTTGTMSAASSFTVSNTGGSPSGPISAIVTGANATEFTVQNGCQTLVAAGTCTVSVTFAPTTDGAKSGTLVVSGSPGGQVMATLVGVAKPPSSLAISPQGNHSFGQVVVGQVAATPQIFTVTNNGGAATGTLLVTQAGADPSQFVKTADGCNGMTLQPLASCMFTVNFTPTTSGAKAASYDVTANPGGSVSAAVSGNAVTNASLQLAPMIGQFGTVVIGSSSDVTFTGVNSGGVTTGTLATAITGADALQFTITGNTCTGATLAPNATCTVIVHYTPTTPTSGTTSKVAALTLTGAPGGTATATFQALANTIGSLTIGPAPNPHLYGTVLTGQTVNATFTVTNPGATAIGPLSTALGGPNADQFNVVAGSNGCAGTTLAALGGACTVVVQYAPTTSGPAAGNFTVTAGSSVVQMGLNGLGQSPAALTINNSSHDFGSVTIGSSSPAFVFTIKNSGGTDSGIPGVTITGPNSTNFTSTNNCNAALTPNATCTVSVTFSATAPAGAKSATLNVTGVPGGTVTADLSGDALGPAQIAVNPGSLTFIGPDGPNGDSTLVGNSSLTQSFTVINNGATPTTAITFANSGPNAADFTQTNNCTTLTNGQTCTVIVTFSPTNFGHRTATITASAATGGSAGVAVAGDALSKLQIIAPATNPFDFGTLVIGPTGNASVCIQVRNNSSLPLTFVRTFTGFSCAAGVNTGDTCTPTPNSEYHRNGAGCGNQPCGNESLNAVNDTNGLDSCGQFIKFVPTMAGVQNASILFSAGAGATNNATQNLTGNGNSNALTITPGGSPGNVGFDYGMVAAGTSKSQVFTVTNQSGSPAGKLSSSISNGPSFHVTADGCTGLPLAIGASCMITVTYFGNDTSSATLSVADSTGAVNTATDVLSVSNAGPSTLEVTSATITTTDSPNSTTDSFGNVFSGETLTHDYQVQLVGGSLNSGPLNIALTGDPSYVVQTGMTGLPDCVNNTTVLGTPPPATAIANCHVRVRFAPTGQSFGTRAAKLVISGNPGGAVTINISGTAKSAISISPDGNNQGGTGHTANLGEAVIGGVATATPPPFTRVGFVMHNASNSPVTFTSVTSSSTEFAPGVDAMDIAPICSGSIPAGASCNFHVTFTPTGSPGLRGDQKGCDGNGNPVSPVGTGGNPCASINPVTGATNTPSASAVVLTALANNGTGTAFVYGAADSKASLTVSPASANFGSTTTGTSGQTLTFAITNTSIGPVGPNFGQTATKVTPKIATGSTSSYVLTSSASNGCVLNATSHTIAAVGVPGASESGNTATFTTTAAHGLLAGDTVNVVGVGVAGYNGTWIVASVPTTTTFTAVIVASGLANSGGGTVTQGQDLKAGQSCNVDVTFTPMGTGALVSQLSAPATGAGSSTTNTVTLTGDGLATGPNGNDVTVAPSAKDFGTLAVGTSSATSTLFKFSNTTLQPQSYTLALPVDFTIDAATTTCLQTPPANVIAASGFCLVGVKFSPATVGFKTGVLKMTLTGPTTQGSVSVGLQGTAINATSVSGLATHDFGQVLVTTTTAPFEYVVTNSGAGPITNINVAMALGGMHSTEFAISGTCQAATLAPGQSCTVDVTWTPTGASMAPISATMNFSADGLTIPVTLTGTGRNPVSLSVSPTTVQDDGTRAIAHLDGTPTIFTVTNAALSAKTNGLLIHIPNFTCSDGTNLNPPYTAVPLGSCIPGDPEDFTLTTVGVTAPVCDLTGYNLFQQNPTFTFPAGTIITHTVLDGGQSCSVGVLYSPTHGPSPVDMLGMVIPKSDGTTVTFDANIPFGPSGFGFESDCTTSPTCVHGMVTGASTDTISGPAGAVHVMSGQPVMVTFTNNGTVATNPVRIDQTGLNNNCTTPATATVAASGCTTDTPPQVSIVADTCTGNAIAPAGTCTVTVRFDSNGAGFTSTSLTLHAAVSEAEPPFGFQHTHHQQLNVAFVP